MKLSHFLRLTFTSLLTFLIIFFCHPMLSQAKSVHGQQTLSDQIMGMASVTASDIWAVGSYFDSKSMQSRTLTEHWNGNQWSIVQSLDQGTLSNMLYGATALASNNVWTVGYVSGGGTHPDEALIEHWNGKQWSIVPAVPMGNNTSRLFAVTAFSANDIWAVGTFIPAHKAHGQPLVEHWNGSQWRFMALPARDVDNYLNSVTTIAPNNIWAVGGYASPNGFNRGFIEHWNGTQWHIVPAPQQGPYDNYFQAIAGISSNDLWVTGTYEVVGQNGLYYYQTLVEHWDGRMWKIVNSPSEPPSRLDVLDNVVALSPNNIWACGSYLAQSPSYPQSLIEHWDGVKWRIISSPDRQTGSNFLAGITAITPDNIWVAGDFAPANKASTLTLFEHWNGSRWNIVPGPNK